MLYAALSLLPFVMLVPTSELHCKEGSVGFSLCWSWLLCIVLLQCAAVIGNKENPVVHASGLQHKGVHQGPPTCMFDVC